VAIWEGSTNVCSMDFVRAMRTHHKTLDAFISECSCLLDQAATQNGKHHVVAPNLLEEAIHKTNHALKHFEKFARKFIISETLDLTSPSVELPSWLSVIREFGFSAARIYISALLLHRAMCGENPDKLDFLTAIKWNERSLLTLEAKERSELDTILNEDKFLALDLTSDGKPHSFGKFNTKYGIVRSKI